MARKLLAVSMILTLMTVSRLLVKWARHAAVIR